MTDLMKQLTARKVERRRQLAALPVGEKLRMLEDGRRCESHQRHATAETCEPGAHREESSRGSTLVEFHEPQSL
jgi:hypothetical protein